MKRNQPELFERAAHICEYQDCINWRLTGRSVTSLNNMPVRWHYRSRDGGLPLRCSTSWTSQTSSRSRRRRSSGPATSLINSPGTLPIISASRPTFR